MITCGAPPGEAVPSSASAEPDKLFTNARLILTQFTIRVYERVARGCSQGDVPRAMKEGLGR